MEAEVRELEAIKLRLKSRGSLQETGIFIRVSWEVRVESTPSAGTEEARYSEKAGSPCHIAKGVSGGVVPAGSWEAQIGAQGPEGCLLS